MSENGLITDEEIIESAYPNTLRKVNGIHRQIANYWHNYTRRTEVEPLKERIRECQSLQSQTLAALMKAESQLKTAREQAIREGRKQVVDWLERVKKIKVPKYQLKEWNIPEGGK